jgi:ribose transport system substrate-binding protein
MRIRHGLVLALVAAAVLAAGSQAAPQKTKLPTKTIGIMGPVDSAEIIKLGDDATEAAAKALGWKVIRVDPGGDPAKMAAGMTSLVNSHVDAIVLQTIEPGQVAAGLRAAKARGIPVIDTGTVNAPSPLITARYYVSPPIEFNLLHARMKKDLASGSELGAIFLPQFLNAKLADDMLVAAAPKAGWKLVATHDADLTNLVGDTTKAVTDMLNAHPDIKAIWGCCDFAATGAVPSIHSAGKTVPVYALHGVPSTIELAKAGGVIVEVGDYQKGGIIAVDQLARFWTAHVPIAKTTPKQYAFKYVIVDKTNAAKGYPFPTSKVIAPFLAKWKRLYVKAG